MTCVDYVSILILILYKKKFYLRFIIKQTKGTSKNIYIYILINL